MTSAQDDTAAYWRALRICQRRVRSTETEMLKAYHVKLQLALKPKGRAGRLARAALLKYHNLIVVPCACDPGNGERKAA